MNEKNLVWNEIKRDCVFDCGVFSVWESFCASPEQGADRNFSVIEAKDWVIVVPLIENQFVMVWQWRHGAQSLSLEFPGGVCEAGETPEMAAVRELQEETGYRAKQLIKLSDFSPNPAIMSNKFHIFLAKDLINLQNQNPDEDEFLEVTLVNVKEVINGMGRAPYIHALMASALLMAYPHLP
jgi:8-oxo-dGTP pyrophosphatase MutT (NUDIX family)